MRIKFFFLSIFLFIYALSFGKNILLGDSNVGVIAKTSGFGSLNLIIGVNKTGINTIELANMLKTVKIDTSVKKVFVAIGTNDLYVTNSSNILKAILLKKYPNAILYVIWGSRGWGQDKYKTIYNEENFYNNFAKNGFIEIRVTNGYFKTEKSAHTPTQKYHYYIIKMIHIII